MSKPQVSSEWAIRALRQSAGWVARNHNATKEQKVLARKAWRILKDAPQRLDRFVNRVMKGRDVSDVLSTIMDAIHYAEQTAKPEPEDDSKFGDQGGMPQVGGAMNF